MERKLFFKSVLISNSFGQTMLRDFENSITNISFWIFTSFCKFCYCNGTQVQNGFFYTFLGRLNCDWNSRTWCIIRIFIIEWRDSEHGYWLMNIIKNMLQWGGFCSCQIHSLEFILNFSENVEPETSVGLPGSNCMSFHWKFQQASALNYHTVP